MPAKKKATKKKAVSKERRLDDTRFTELLDLLDVCNDNINNIAERLGIVNDNCNYACDKIDELDALIKIVRRRMGVWNI